MARLFRHVGLEIRRIGGLRQRLILRRIPDITHWGRWCVFLSRQRYIGRLGDVFASDFRARLIFAAKRTASLSRELWWHFRNIDPPKALRGFGRGFPRVGREGRAPPRIPRGVAYSGGGAIAANKSRPRGGCALYIAEKYRLRNRVRRIGGRAPSVRILRGGRAWSMGVSFLLPDIEKTHRQG